MPGVKRLHNAINVKKQRTPLIDPRIGTHHLPLSKVEGDLGFSLDEARRVFPTTLKAWESVEGDEESVSEAKLFASHRESVGHRDTLSRDLLDRHGVRDILWGASEVNAHTDEDDPRRAEILNLYEDTTHLAKDIISNDDEIVGPLKSQRGAEPLKRVNEPEAHDERVSAQRRERL
jgi:hypothetical protein